MDTDSDYKKMGTQKDCIEVWEDGKRDDDRAGVYEWWYFDMILDDGSKAVIHTSTAKPWRPGAGGFAFGDDGYFTWLCAVPRGTVTGTLYYDGKEHQVTGAGYHDHQWGNVKHNSTWDHWIWGSQESRHNEWAESNDLRCVRWSRFIRSTACESCRSRSYRSMQYKKYRTCKISRM